MASLSTNTSCKRVRLTADLANRLSTRIKVVLLVRCPLVSLGRYMSAHLLSRLVLAKANALTYGRLRGGMASYIAQRWWRALRERLISSSCK